VLELGAGTGVISMVIAALQQPHEIAALEIQPELTEVIRRNAKLNGITSIRAIPGDLREVRNEKLVPESFDVVVANPPYRASKTGRVSPHHGRRIARSESSATLEDFVTAASRYTRRGGRVGFVFAADRSAELISVLREHRLEPKRIRFVHAYADSPATNILIEARKAGGIEVAIEAPLVLFDTPGIYSREAREILGEVASPPPAK
jgi:tRNA1Val (adenine37-N6)-methyltransferase